ncbi:hypothetical protein GCM10028801_33480 [Nocardioides maradonensis]
MTDITAVMTGHNEGELLVTSWRSMLAAADHARAAGLTVDFVVMLDRPDDATLATAEVVRDRARVEVLDLGDHGIVRNEAIGLAEGEYVAFLDGDDLWSENWLTAAYDVCRADPDRVVAHPALNWFFEGQSNLFFIADQDDPDFYAGAFLRVANPWDQLCMASRALHLAYPYPARDLAVGYAYVDWSWNLATVEAGCVHRVVEDTIHFKRRRSTSQLTLAQAASTIPWPSALHSWGEQPSG